MRRTERDLPKHPTYNHRPIPTFQLLSKLSTFNATRGDRIVNKRETAPSSSSVKPTSSSDENENKLFVEATTNPNNAASSARDQSQRESDKDNIALDPFRNTSAPSNETSEFGKHRGRYTAHMQSSVGKILHEKEKDNAGDNAQFIPGRKMMAPKLSNENHSLIGGIEAQVDPYQTVTQQMQAGMEGDRNARSRKKTLRDFEPELFVSPITGEKIANYGTWADDLKNSKQAAPVTVSVAEEDPTMAKLKTQLNARGAKGIVGLSRLFRIMDDDGSGSLSFQEFKKAMREIGMTLSDSELIVLFKKFDMRGQGFIFYNDFLTCIAGSLNSRRRELVRMAFAVLDKDKSGIVNLDDIAIAYDTSKHPDVLSGKRTKDEVLLEFLDQFEVGGDKDGRVTPEEFERYYAAISASIPSDDYFELMIRNAWHISGGSGASANTSNLRVLATLSDGTQRVVEIENDLGLNPRDSAAILARLKAQGVPVASVSAVDAVDTREQRAGSSRPRSAGRLGSSGATTRTIPRSTANDAVTRSTEPSAGVKLLIGKIKKEMRARGSGGYVGLQRRFRIMDDDHSKSLSLAEFKKALKEFNMDLSESDLRMIFSHFDKDDSGSIDFEEFVQGVRDPLNARRLALVESAFALLDKDGSGMVDAKEIATMYDASRHPEVLAKRKTATQVLKEFLDTFDVGGVKDGMVTQGEFVNYYTNLGANIDNDDYFELMIRNAWHMNGGEGAAANTTNLKVLVTNSAGAETTITLQNDLGVKKDDISQIYARLRSQGVSDIYAINGKIVRVLNVNGVDIVTIAGDTSQLDSDARGAPKVLRAPPALRPYTAKAVKPPSMSNPKYAWAESTTAANSQNLRVDKSQMSSNVLQNLRQQQEARVKENQDQIIANALLDMLRTQIFSRGSTSLIDLQRIFIGTDSNGSKSLDLTEFKASLDQFDVHLPSEQVSILFKRFDQDNSGLLEYDEFLSTLRGPINPRLLVLVHRAFDHIDTAGKGTITPQDLLQNYDASRHPDVSTGVRTENAVLQELLDTFDVGGIEVGLITREEFVTYYHNIIAAMKDDDYMELVLRRTWRLGEDPQIVDRRNSNTIREFRDQQRRPAPRPSSSNNSYSGSENSVKGRIKSAQSFGDEYWGIVNGQGLSHSRPSTAGAQRATDPKRFTSQIEVINEDKLNSTKKEAVKMYNAQRYQESELLFKQALEIAKSIFPPNHPECIKGEKSVLLVQRKLAQNEKPSHR